MGDKQYGSKKKLKIQIFFLLAFALLILPSVNALTITNTTFFSSESNSTIFVDSITLDNVTTTVNETIFINLTSIGSNFTNTNTTNAFANFIGLTVDLTIRNINTSTDLFTSMVGNEDFNVTFSAGQLIRILDFQTSASLCSPATRVILNLTVLFFALAIMIIPLSFLFNNGKLSIDSDPRILLVIFIGIILGVAFTQVIASSVVSACA